ncbi:DUF2529 family protein [Evansella clarkii]|jgi:hypothetical protein|uniref:DUF2529 family protein n=1 Tax=Evansella clarkii TaxID=79879 RepID=UPI0009982978|nr:DUF2529 family protein [Evansella clarkii]
MKVFQTQLQGLLNKYEEFEDKTEDFARIISQTIISDGQLWIYGEKEMHGITDQALSGTDALPTIMEAVPDSAFSSLDTILIWSPDPLSKDACKIASAAKKAGAQVLGFTSELNKNKEEEVQGNLWQEECSMFLSTGVKGGLVPTEEGNRIGAPHLLTALHLYYLVFFNVMEFLEEHEM